MDQRRSACRNPQAHAAHGFHTAGYAAWIECPGWTDAEAATTDLIERLNQVAREHCPPLKMPEGIRLECHPLVGYALSNMFIPGYAEFVSSLQAGDNLLKPQIPVMHSPAMERGAWRIVHGDRGQHLIAEGVIPDSVTA
jgi:hypothetical protein